MTSRFMWFGYNEPTFTIKYEVQIITKKKKYLMPQNHSTPKSHSHTVIEERN